MTSTGTARRPRHRPKLKHVSSRSHPAPAPTFSWRHLTRGCHRRSDSWERRGMTPDEGAVVSCVLDYFEGVRRRPGAHAARTPSRSGQAVARGGTLEHVTAPEMVETTAAGSLRTIPAAGVSMFASWTSTETSHLSSSTRTSTATSTSCASRAAGRSQTPSGSSLRGPIERYALGYAPEELLRRLRHP